MMEYVHPYCIMVLKCNKLQNKALRIMNFESPRASSNPLFTKSVILKFGDQIKLSNFLFAYDNLRCNLYLLFYVMISSVNPQHNVLSRNQEFNQLNVRTVRTVTAESNSVIKSKSASAWNNFNKLLDKNSTDSIISKYLCQSDKEVLYRQLHIKA